MAKISDFLQELAKPAGEESSVRDKWHTRDREDAMKDFGLSTDQQATLRQALESEDLGPVQDSVQTEIQDQGKVHVYLWVK